jgi:hypothetical protein
MQQFDSDYMARREKEIREQHELRSISQALFVFSIIGVIATAVFINTPVVPIFTALITLGVSMAATILFFIQRGKASADAAIQAEYERIRALMPAEKRKNETVARLKEDGELEFDADSEPRKTSASRR